jgi:gamma-glutamylcyclotransferase (GGCT)/AIG2-like uncharacterized protein YtfP
VRNDAALLMLFYGTLKRGYRNHNPFCRGGHFVEEASLRGKVYGLSLGYPALIVPEEDVYAVGTASPLQDVAEQRRLAREHGEARPLGDPWVFGELFAFDDPETRLPALDRLEGFDPEAESSPYRRVLLPVETSGNAGVFAWAYVVEATSGVHLPKGRWPA